MRTIPSARGAARIVAAVLLLSAGGCQKPGPEATAPSPPAPLAAGQAAPDFTLKDINGNILSSRSLSGKPLVINFFATWCPPCREEIPGFVEVHNKYKGKGFELVGIALDTDTRENLPGFVMNHRIGYRILLGNLETTRAYGGISTITTTVFVGRDGTIRRVVVGYIDRDGFEQEVKKLL